MMYACQRSKKLHTFSITRLKPDIRYTGNMSYCGDTQISPNSLNRRVLQEKQLERNHCPGAPELDLQGPLQAREQISWQARRANPCASPQ